MVSRCCYPANVPRCNHFHPSHIAHPAVPSPTEPSTVNLPFRLSTRRQMLNPDAEVNQSPSDPSPPPPGPSVPMVYSLISVKSSIHGILPVMWDVIKIRLSTAIVGPSSSIISSERTYPECSVVHKRRSNGNYHTVIVREVNSDLVAGNFTLHVWPVPAYSRATNLGYTTTLEWFLDQPLNVRNKHVPMPRRPGMIAAPTPVVFGPPLYVGGYTDRVYSWVLLEPHAVTMSFENTVSAHSPTPIFYRSTIMTRVVKWKRFDPPVKVSIIEARSLELYYRHLEQQQKLDNSVTQSSPQPPAASGGLPPGDSLPPRGNPPTEDDSQSSPLHTGQQPRSSGSDGSSDTTHREDNGAPTDLAKSGSTLRRNSTTNWSYYKSFTSSTVSASSTVSDTVSDGIDPITFARQHIGDNPMWEEMVNRWDNLMDIAAWVRHVREAVEIAL